MSANGHGPSQVVSLADLLAATTEAVRLPRASSRVGSEVTVKIRCLSRAEYFNMLPPPIPGSETWTPETWSARLLEHLNGLTIEQRRQHDLQWFEVALRVVAAGVLEPSLTAEQARALGDDIDELSQKILEFSGLTPKATQPDAQPAAT